VVAQTGQAILENMCVVLTKYTAVMCLEMTHRCLYAATHTTCSIIIFIKNSKIINHHYSLQTSQIILTRKKVGFSASPMPFNRWLVPFSCDFLTKREDEKNAKPMGKKS
jgi:hypothetical protein